MPDQSVQSGGGYSQMIAESRCLVRQSGNLPDDNGPALVGQIGWIRFSCTHVSKPLN
jgi:hypothetical protein